MTTTPVSLLSYNINLLPFGRQHVPSHANKDERMSQFISLITTTTLTSPASGTSTKTPATSTSTQSKSSPLSSPTLLPSTTTTPSSSIDIVALQEVYGSPFLPSFAVPSLCRQTRMIEQFRTRGYPYHAACEQPSFFSMVSKRTFTDSGLIIISKYPIEHVGSVAFAPPPPLATLRQHLQQQQNLKQSAKTTARRRTASSSSSVIYSYGSIIKDSDAESSDEEQEGIEDDEDDDADTSDVSQMNQKDITNSTNFATSPARSAGQPGCLFAAVRVPDKVGSSSSGGNSGGVSGGTLLLVFNVHLSMCNRHEYQLLQSEADTVILSDDMLKDDDDDQHDLSRSSRTSTTTRKPSASSNARSNTNTSNTKANKVAGRSLSYSFTNDFASHQNHNINSENNNNNNNINSNTNNSSDFGLTPTQRSQVTELRHFIEGVLQQFPRGTPFIICGDFNVNALHQVDSIGKTRPSRAYLELKAMLSPLLAVSGSKNASAAGTVDELKNANNNLEASASSRPTAKPEDSSSSSAKNSNSVLSEALLDSLGYHPPTRPLSAATQLADSPFSSYVGGVNRAKMQLRLNSSFSSSSSSSLSASGRGGFMMTLRSQEMRHDYIFYSGEVASSSISLSKDRPCRIERFAMPEGSFPFRFLSDHFALIANFDLKRNENDISKYQSENHRHANNNQTGIGSSSSSSSSRQTTTNEIKPSSIFKLSPTTISILQSFPSLVVSLLVPKDVTHQRSGATLPIGAIEILLLAVMFASLPFWLMIGAIGLLIGGVITFFMIIQRKNPVLFQQQQQQQDRSDLSSSLSLSQNSYLDVALIDDDTIAGKAPVKIALPSVPSSKPSDDEIKSSSVKPHHTVAEMWRTSVANAGWLPALGPSLFLSHCYSHGWLDQPYAHDDTNASEVITDFHHSFLTYSELDRLALSLANGMLALCASLPEISTISTSSTIISTQQQNIAANTAATAPTVSIQTSYRVGVLMQSSPTALLIDLAFLVYGHVRIDDIYELPNTAPLIAVPLIGEAQALRTELDDAGCNVAIVTVSQARTILTCHARHLHTVILVPDEPFYFLQQSSAGFNPKYHQHSLSSKHQQQPFTTKEQFEHLFGSEEADDGQDDDIIEGNNGNRKSSSPSASSAANRFHQEINNPVLAGASNSLAARDASSIPATLELLATENSIQLVSIGELLHNGCILTREGRFQQTRRSDDDEQDNKNNIGESQSNVNLNNNNSRIPHEDALATVMLDCRSTEANYVSTTSPFNKRQKKSPSQSGEEIEEDATPIYGRLLRLSHKQVSRFVTQISDTGIIPKPSWSNRPSSPPQTQTSMTGDSSTSPEAATSKLNNGSKSTTSSPNKSTSPTIQNTQSRILFQDIHNSYFERWSALCSLVNGHITIVTRSNVFNSNANSFSSSASSTGSHSHSISSSSSSFDSLDVNATLSSRSFHGSCIALKPHIAFTSLLPMIASRDLYDKIVSAGFSRFGILQNLWSFAFRNMVRFRDQLNERDFDSNFIYRAFFKWITTTFFGTRIQRVIVSSDEAVPYRVRHFLQLLIPSSSLQSSSISNYNNNNNLFFVNSSSSHHQFLTVAFSPNVGLVHVNGTPPPKTLIRIMEREEQATTNEKIQNNNNNDSSQVQHHLLSGEIDLSGPAVLGIDKDSGGFASSGLIGEWHQRQVKINKFNAADSSSSSSSQHVDLSPSSPKWKLQILCTGDALVRPGSISSLHDIIKANINKYSFLMMNSPDSSSSSSSFIQQQSTKQRKRFSAKTSHNIMNDDEEDAFQMKSFFASVRELKTSHTTNGVAAAIVIPYVSATALERAYMHECSFLINDMFVWSHDGFPLVAVVMPNRPILLELLVARIIQLRKKILAESNKNNNKKNDKKQQQQRQQQRDENEDDDSNIEDPLFSSNQTDDELLRLEDETTLIQTVYGDSSILFRSDVAKEIVVRACQVAFLNAGLSHEILAVHLHPHPFSAHSDFARANGSRRRSRMVEYFLEEIERLYIIAIKQIQSEKRKNDDSSATSTSASNNPKENAVASSSNHTSPYHSPSPSETEFIGSSHIDVAGQNSHHIRNSDSENKPPSSSAIDNDSILSNSSLAIADSSTSGAKSAINQQHAGSTNNNNNNSTATMVVMKPKIRPVAPFAVDIGGTCAKIVFFLPGDADTRGLIPSYCTVEKNDPATAALGAAIDDSAIQEMMNESAVMKYGLQQTHHQNQQQGSSSNKSAPSSSVSFRLVCMKLSTSMMSRFIQHLAAAPILAQQLQMQQTFANNNNNNNNKALPISSSLQRIPSEKHLRTASSSMSNATSADMSRADTPATTSNFIKPHSSSAVASKPSSPTSASQSRNNTGTTTNSNNHFFASPSSSSFIPPSLATSSNASSKLAFMFKRESLQHVPATGGGAFRFQGAARSHLGMGLEPVKEMESLVRGLNILLDRCLDLAVFSYDTRTHSPARHKLTMIKNQPQNSSSVNGSNNDCHEKNKNTASAKSASRSQQGEEASASSSSSSSSSSSPYPFLLVNVGSGVSIVKLGAGDGSFVRVGGSPVGGATFWGLARAITNINTWEELREITRVDGPGDHTKVDLLVGDIYGYNATALPAGLTVDTLASSCGKMASSGGGGANRNNQNEIANNKNASPMMMSSSSLSLPKLSKKSNGEISEMNASNNNGNKNNGNNNLQRRDSAVDNAARGTLDDDDTAELLDWTQEAIHMATPKNIIIQQQQNISGGNLEDNSNDIANRHNSSSEDELMMRHSREHSRTLSNAGGGELVANGNNSTAGDDRISISSANNNSYNNNASSSSFQNKNNNHNNSVSANAVIPGANNANNNNNNTTSSVDIIRSLLMMVATNITQIAFLYAKQENVKNILFTGGFVRGNALVWNQMTRALHYWSGGQMTAHFLRNDGYVGVLGALLNDQRLVVAGASTAASQAAVADVVDSAKNKEDDDGHDAENDKEE